VKGDFSKSVEEGNRLVEVNKKIKREIE
jgi:hypothetical protein